MWAAKGSAMETHSGWRLLTRSQAAEPFTGMGSCLGSDHGRLSLRFWGRHVHSEKRLETGSSCCCDHEAASDASGTGSVTWVGQLGVKEDHSEVLVCWVLCLPLLLETGEQSGFQM